MGTVVLSPQDCIRNRFSHEFVALSPDLGNRRYSKPNHNPNPNASRPRRRNRSPSESQATQHKSPDRSPRSRSTVVQSPAKNMVMGQVKILKRGQAMVSSLVDNCKVDEKPEEVVKSETDLGMDLVVVPEVVVSQKQMIMDCLYAGSGFFTSPPPSSVPHPSFLRKNGAATSDLRRLLKLDLV